MRLLFLCPDLRTGGAERQWGVLIRGLHERGCDLGVLCLSGEGPIFAELAAAGVPVDSAGMRGRTDQAGIRRALRAGLDASPQAVISRGVNAQALAPAIARRTRAAQIVTEHTPLTAEGRLLPMRFHQRLITRVLAPWVDRVVAVTAAQVEPLTGLGYPRGRVEVIHNGVVAGEPAAPGGREAVRRELGLGADDVAVLVVAALRPEKRIDLFIAALAAARRVNPSLRGFVAGEGRERGRLERLAGETDGGVRLLGSRADVPGLMLAADAVCLPSDAEALPMSVLEAMALARPVVATRVGGMAEAVAHRDTGLLVAPGDAAALSRALLELAGDRERARLLGERGRERQRELFDAAAMVERYEGLFERVARSSPAAVG